MTTHATVAILEKLRSGALPPAELLAVSRHVAGCAECGALAEALVDPAAMAKAFAAAVVETGHPALETELAAAAAGRASDAVREHVEGCATCREDVEDLRRAPVRPVRWLVAAAAAAVVIALSAIALWPRRPSPPPAVPTASVKAPPQPSVPVAVAPRGYGRAEWDRLVAEVRRNGALPAAAVLAELRPVPDAFRNAGAASAFAELRPAGEVIETTRPRFTWPAVEGTRSVVVVYASGKEVARSEAVDRGPWTAPRPLRRGTTYTWQVEIVRDGNVTDVLPAPPAPPALFRVAGAAAIRELDEARRAFPGDHLLLAALYARHGMASRAEEELAAAARRPPPSGD